MVLLAVASCDGTASPEPTSQIAEALTYNRIGAVFGNGYVEWKTTAGNTFCGFSRLDANQNYDTIDFALYAAGTSLYVYESGVQKAYVGAVTTSDVLRVEVNGTTVTYKKNGSTLYTSATAATAPLLVDTAFYTYNDKISNVVLSIDGQPATPVTSWRRVRGVDITGNTLRANGVDSYSTGWGLHGASGALAGENYAAASNGATVSVSSTYNTWYPKSVINDGDRAGLGIPNFAFGWWNTGVQSSGTCFNNTQWTTIDFGTTRTIQEVDVFSVQNNYSAPVEPYAALTKNVYGLYHFHVRYWNGSAWVDVPNGYVTFNSSVWRRITFAPLTTRYIDVTIECQDDTWGRIVEVEAWGSLPSCDMACSAKASCSPDARCLNANGAVTTCDDYGMCNRGTCASYCGGIFVRNCSSTCTAGDGYTATCGEMGYSCTGTSTLLPPPCSSCTTSSNYYEQCSIGGGTSTCGAQGVYAGGDYIKGAISLSGGYDVNRCVYVPPVQVRTLNQTGSAFTIAYDQSALGFSPSCDGHWQTIQRLQNDPSRFVMTLSNETGSLGYLATGYTPTGNMADGTVQHLQLTPSPYNHPGGGQALGDYFFVAFEKVGFTAPGAVGVYSTTSLASTQTLDQKGNLLYMPSGVNGAGQVAVAKLAPVPGEVASRYLLVVGGPADTTHLYFYLSPPGASLEYGATAFTYQGEQDLTNGRGWDDYQNFNLVTDCDTGELYLVTLSRDGDSWCSFSDGDDYVKIFKVNAYWNPALRTLTTSGIDNTYPNGWLEARHMYSWGNFDAAAGVYVDANHNLTVYATEHRHDGPNGSIKSNVYVAP